MIDQKNAKVEITLDFGVSVSYLCVAIKNCKAHICIIQKQTLSRSKLRSNPNPTTMEIKNVKRDINGNSRYVVHFLAFSDTFQEAHKMAKKIGGSKYRGKDFGGGLVFQAHSEKDLENLINDFLEKAVI